MQPAGAGGARGRQTGSASSPHPIFDCLSIVILTRNAGPRFEEVLDQLFSCRGIDDAEVLVIDSGSTDGTLDLAARRRLQIHRIDPDRFGHGRTRNLGASLATGEIVVFLVQDATPRDEDFLEQLVQPLEDPVVAGTYGRQIARPEASAVEAVFLSHTYPEREEVRELPREPGRVSIRSIFFSNVCSAIRREVLARHPFDEELIMSEDQRWARDVLEAGYRIVYRPEAVVLHSHAYSLGKTFRRNFDSGYSLVGVVQDNPREMLRYQIGFLTSAAASLVREHRLSAIPRLLLHEAARAWGFFLGRNARFLPHSLRRRLSLHRAYWDRPEAEP